MILKLTLLIISIFGGSVATLKTRYYLKRKEREMLKSITRTFHACNKRAYIFDPLNGYYDFMKKLEDSIEWLETGTINPLEFLKFQTEFMEEMQGKHRGIIISCMSLSQSRLHLSTKYFGEFPECNY